MYKAEKDLRFLDSRKSGARKAKPGHIVIGQTHTMQVLSGCFVLFFVNGLVIYIIDY